MKAWKLLMPFLIGISCLVGCADDKDAFCPGVCPNYVQTFDKDITYHGEKYLLATVSQEVYDDEANNTKHGMLRLRVKNKTGVTVDSCEVLVSVYKSSVRTYENLLFKQLYKAIGSIANDDTVGSFLVSSDAAVIVNPENVVVELLYLKKNNTNYTHALAGLYNGDFYTYSTADADSVLKYFNTTGGNINADGSIRFSLGGEKEYRLLTGNVDAVGICIASVNKDDGTEVTDVSSEDEVPVTLSTATPAQLTMLLKTPSQFQDFSTLKFITERLKP